MILFDAVLKRQIRCLFLEDNQATLRIITTGQNQALRHVLRTRRVNVHWVSQVCREQPIDLEACESHLIAGDMFTKCFGISQKWYEVMKRIPHMPWSDFLKLFNQGNKPYPQDVKQ